MKNIIVTSLIILSSINAFAADSHEACYDQALKVAQVNLDIIAKNADQTQGYIEENSISLADKDDTSVVYSMKGFVFTTGYDITVAMEKESCSLTTLSILK